MASSFTKRRWWAPYLCNTSGLISSPRFGNCYGGPIKPVFHEPAEALATVLAATGYRVDSCWAYNCRKSTGASVYSLHSYPGLARDINPPENPYLLTPSLRKVRISGAGTQELRYELVKARDLDTTFTPYQIERIKAIRFIDDTAPAFSWGGDWRTKKDAMHWEVDRHPDIVSRGIDWATVDGAGEDMSRYFKQGDESDWIAEVQAVLVMRGYDLGDFGPDGDGVDRQAGAATFAAILAERAKNPLTVSYDADFFGPKDAGYLFGFTGRDIVARVAADEARITAEQATLLSAQARDIATEAEETANGANVAAGRALNKSKKANGRIDGIVLTVPE